MNRMRNYFRTALFAGCLSLSLSSQCQYMLIYADTTINASPPNTGNYTLNDAGFITVNANITQTNADGSGGLIDLTAGTIITINNGRTLNVSATVAGKNGGTINLTAPAILINGVLRANGNGSGRGGTINLTGTGAGGAGSNYIQFGGSSIVEAKGGNSNGLGGLINIIGNGNTYISTAAGSVIESSGAPAAGANEIYITGDGTQNGGVAINHSGDIMANGLNSNQAGGTIHFTATDGSIKHNNNSVTYANGVGSGVGGTIAFLMSNGAGSVDIDNTNYLNLNNGSDIRVSNGGGNRSGTIIFGRSTVGTMSPDFSNNLDMFSDVQNVSIGNFTNNNVTSITASNYRQNRFMDNGTTINFNATGNITATNNMRILNINAVSTAGGNISLWDQSGSITVQSVSTAGNFSVNADAGSLTLNNANIGGTSILQARNNITANDVDNFFGGAVSAYGDNGPADSASVVNIRSTGDLTINNLYSRSTTTLNAAGGDLTLSNYTTTSSSVLSASGSITGTANTNFGTTTSVNAGTTATLSDSSGTFTLANVTTGDDATFSSATGSIPLTTADIGGDLDITSGNAGTFYDITLTSVSVTGNTFLAAGDDITATSGNNFTGSVSAYGENGIADYADSVNITDNTGDLTLDRLTIARGTITAAAANSNLTASNVQINNSTVDFVAPKNISVSTSTINGNDTLRLTSSSNGNISLIGNSISSITGTTAAPSGTIGLYFGTGTGTTTLTNNTVSGATTIGSAGTPMQGDVSGAGNSFTGATSFYVNTASKDIDLTSDFQNATNAFSGRNVTVVDNSNALTISSVTATNLTATASGSGAASDLTITNANVSGSSNLTAQSDLTANSGTNVNFGTVTASAGASGGNLTIAETTPITVNTITNSSATGTTTVTSTGGAITATQDASANISSTGTGAVTVTASSAANGYVDLRLNTGGNTNIYANAKNGSNDSIVLRGSVGGNLTASNSTSGNTTGNILLGDWNTDRTLDVTGSITFKSAADVNGYGTFTGMFAGSTGYRVDLWQIGATDLVIGDITATATASGATELFAGYGNVLNIYVPDASIVDNSDPNGVDLTAANGGVTLWAGSNATKTGSYIRAGISSGGDVYMWVAGDSNGNGTGKSINVETGNISGDIVAVDETWDKTTGDIFIQLASGNLTTKDVGSGRNVTLKALNGNVLQNNAYGFQRDITVYSTGDTTIQAGDNVADASSYIDTGVYVQGNALFIAAGKSASNDSVIAVGRVDGTTTVRNESGVAVKGNVYLGTDLLDPNLLNDSSQVMDTYGDVNVNALGDVYLNGGIALNGALTVTGNTITIRQDIGRTKIANITATKTTGTVIDIFNYGNEKIIGDLSGTDINTSGTGSVLLRAGNSYPNDASAYITDLNVNIGGDLTAYVAGDSNGASAGGVSVNITGTVTGASNAYDETGGSPPRGSVTMP